ncbi:MAG: Planktothrix phage PaV-LD [Cyanobacteriota bacterium]|jgi:hypothetical protein
MNNSTKIKLIALDREVTVSEETFTIKELKVKYPKQWLQSRNDYPVFINSCMDKWISEQVKLQVELQVELKWNVVTFEVG